MFAADGLISGSVLNAPGVYHDSAIADCGMYELMVAKLLLIVLLSY